MKILVTGGAGYVGSKLVPRLLENYQVRVVDSLSGESLSPFFDNPSFEFTQGDIRDIVYQSLEAIDAVIHLAAIVPGFGSQPSAQLIYEVNYDATRMLVELCRERKIKRFIFTSTCGNYGISDVSKFATEEDPLDPTSPYAESKVKAEQYVTNSADADFHPTVLRLATVFGLSPKMSFKPLANALLYDALVKKYLKVYGALSWRPFVHVDDVMQAILLVLRAPIDLVSGQVFNVGSNSLNYQKVQLVKLIEKYLPQTKVEIEADVADQRSYKVSFDKIAKILGFQATKTLEEGIKEMKEALENEEISLRQAGVIGE